MAWTTPGTATAGEVLTAAFWNTNVRDNSIMGSPVYANEAARDAAIPAPSEGMQVYLTAPTEPSATGMTITGIRQIYDGAAWTTVSLLSGLITTTETCSSATYADLATVGPTVTIRTGITALVTVSATIDTSAATRGGTMSFAVSGATTISAVDANGVFVYSLDGDVFVAASRTYLLTGLTAGVNTFTAKYKQQGGNVNILRRSLSITGAA
jgi:hypothetical protein